MGFRRCAGRAAGQLSAPDDSLISLPLSYGLVVAALILLAGGLLLGRALRRGRDRQYVGIIPGLPPSSGADPEVRTRSADREAVSVRFDPPDATPALCGVILTEDAGVTEVTATITDLALRGYLEVEELTDGGYYLLTQLRSVDDTVADYEALLLNALFDGRERRLLSDLGGSFAAAVRKAQTAMLDTATRLGWFRSNPRRQVSITRHLAGYTVLAAGIAIVLGKDWDLLWALGPVILLALAYATLAERLPARTAAGTVMHQQVLQFRRYLRVAEAGQIADEERQNVLSTYLPYAQVFGLASDWAGRFAHAAAALPDTWVESRWRRRLRSWRLLNLR